MELSPRQLAFLEHELTEIKNDPTRDMEDRSHASSILGRVEGEIEWEQQQNLNGDVDPEELFA